MYTSTLCKGDEFMEKIASLKDKAYNIIKEKIVKCEYLPNQFLVENELMELVGASRTPIREALNKLEQEGLLVILPKKGVMVKDISLQEVNAIFEARLLVEPYIIKNYGHLLPKEVLQQQLYMVSASRHAVYNEKDYDEDNALHQLLINASGNVYLIGLLHKIYVQNHRIRILSGSMLRSRPEETIAEHEAILQRMLAEDFDGAAHAMEEHLLHAKKAAVEVMMRKVEPFK
jgi:DNA-binding GntR family transcriptional regulator